jgi:hypothetical protein
MAVAGLFAFAIDRAVGQLFRRPVLTAGLVVALIAYGVWLFQPLMAVLFVAMVPLAIANGISRDRALRTRVHYRFPGADREGRIATDGTGYPGTILAVAVVGLLVLALAISEIEAVAGVDSTLLMAGLITIAGVIAIGRAAGYVPFKSEAEGLSFRGPETELFSIPTRASGLLGGRATVAVERVGGTTILRPIRFPARPPRRALVRIVNRPAHLQRVALGKDVSRSASMVVLLADDASAGLTLDASIRHLRPGNAYSAAGARPAVALSAITGRIVLAFDREVDRDRALAELRAESG